MHLVALDVIGDEGTHFRVGWELGGRAPSTIPPLYIMVQVGGLTGDRQKGGKAGAISILIVARTELKATSDHAIHISV